MDSIDTQNATLAKLIVRVHAIEACGGTISGRDTYRARSLIAKCSAQHALVGVMGICPRHGLHLFTSNGGPVVHPNDTLNISRAAMFERFLHLIEMYPLHHEQIGFLIQPQCFAWILRDGFLSTSSDFYRGCV